MMDFTKIKKLFIGGVELKQLFIGNKFDNKVPKSIDTDGSIYQNGKGYIDGYRLTSSGGLSSQANTVTTGYIPCKATDVIRLSGVDFAAPIDQYCYLSLYDSEFNLLGSQSNRKHARNPTGYLTYFRGIMESNNKHSTTATLNHPTSINGVTIFDNYQLTDGSQVAYFRINGYGIGADMIVTVDEEIGMHQIWKSGYKNWVKYSTEADGVTIYNGGLGYKDEYRLSSSGGESTQAYATVTGFMPIKAGDIIRISGCKWYDTASSINYFIVYNSAFGKVYTGNSQSGYQTTTFIESMKYDNTTGISTIVIKPGVSGYEWFRISSRDAKGKNIIVTVNEEIE